MSRRVSSRDVTRLDCSSFHSFAMNILRHADTGAASIFPEGVEDVRGRSQSRKKMS